MEPDEITATDPIDLPPEVVQADVSSQKPAPADPLSWTGWVSWIVILALTSFIIISTWAVQQESIQRSTGDAPAGELIQVRLQGKVLVAQREWERKMLQQLPPPVEKNENENENEANAEQSASEQPISAELSQIDAGTYEQRVAYVFLVNELSGPNTASEALRQLDDLSDEHELTLTDNQQSLRTLAGRLIDGQRTNEFSDELVTEDDRNFLSKRLGWIGELAVVPAATENAAQRAKVLNSAVNMLIVLTVGGCFAMLAFVTGFGLLITALVMLNMGSLASRFNNRRGVHNVYIETFAVWMLVFFGSQFLIPLIGIEDEHQLLMLSPFLAFVTLMALVWPVARGVSWGQVREDIGLKTATPIRDILAAPLAYMATLPLVAVGVGIVTVLLILTSANEPMLPEFSPQVEVSHPVQEHIAQGKPGVFLAVFLAACVAAPIVEEVMFRGVLYRHLRDWSAKWGSRISILFSAAFNGLIFAAIHPQGLVAIPLLMTLAIAFSLVREWRGSLYPGMLMHAINNGLVTCLMFVIL